MNLTEKMCQRVYTYFYNVNSSRKVLHVDNCRYLSSAKCQEFGEKHSVKKALNQGFVLCKHCFLIENRFKSKYGTAYCKNNYKYVCSDNCVDITTGKGEWKIVYAKKSPELVLYHKNKEVRDTDCFSRIRGYHYQDVSNFEFSDIIDYICSHDGKIHLPPPKGSKRYKGYQKKMKKQERQAAINNVLHLIDSLHSV